MYQPKGQCQPPFWSERMRYTRLPRFTTPVSDRLPKISKHKTNINKQHYNRKKKELRRNNPSKAYKEKTHHTNKTKHKLTDD